VDGNGGADSVFRLERGGDRMKRYRQMKWRQQARLGSMGRKRNTVRQRRLEEKRHQGGETEETTLIRLTRILLDQK
jgi:hypothetical protein